MYKKDRKERDWGKVRKNIRIDDKQYSLETIMNKINDQGQFGIVVLLKEFMFRPMLTNIAFNFSNYFNKWLDNVPTSFETYYKIDHF